VANVALGLLLDSLLSIVNKLSLSDSLNSLIDNIKHNQNSEAFFFFFLGCALELPAGRA